MSLRALPITMLLLANCIALPAALAQGTRADYENAASLRKRTDNKVFRDRIEPQWLPGNDRFWYRVDTGPKSHEYVLVDAEQGTRNNAFDHARLAAALGNAGLEGARAENLPIDRLEFKLDEEQLVFRAGGRWWLCDLKNYELKPHKEQETAANGRSLADLPSASRRTGPETEIVFVNQSKSRVELFWIDLEGRRKSYGKIEAGGRRSQHTYAGHVWLVVNDAGKPLTWFQGEQRSTTAEIDGASQAGPPGPRRRWSGPSRNTQRGTSPDGQWQAFIRDDNVFLRTTDEGEEFALSQDGTAEDAYGERFYWSPDSKKLVVMRTRKGEERKVYYVESSPRDQLQPKLHSYDYRKPGDRIPQSKPQLFDVASRKRVSVSDDLFPNPWSINDLRWKSDSSRFTFLYNQRGHQVLRVVAVNSETGQATALIDEQSTTFIDYAHKQFQRWLNETREIIWMSERDGWNHLYLYDADSGDVKHQITRGPWVVLGVDLVDTETRQIWFRAGGVHPDQDPYHVHYCRVNFDGTELVFLTDGDGTHSIEYSPDRRYIVDRWSRVDLPPVTQLRRVTDGSLVCPLEHADCSQLVAAGWHRPERFVAKGRDGKTDIYGVIFRPTSFDPDIEYPVIENIYAGPQDAFVPKSFRAYHKPQSMAELGFIVVKIDGMGTSNRSKAFHDVCWKNLGDSGFPDRILWIQAAAEEYPYMDLSHVGIYGGSAGGQSSTRALLAHGDFYHVAVSDCGCHDNRMDKIWWNELWMGWPIGPHYEEQSNVTQAHELQGKLMLVVGEKDQNVDPASTLQVVDALIRADKDFDLLLIPGAGHGSAESPYGQRRRQDFFVRHLLGVEPRGEP